MKILKNTLKVVALTALISVILCSENLAEEVTNINASTPIEEVKNMASQGNSIAMLELGERQLEGRGIDTNMIEGVQWIRKAADAGLAAAWYDLGYVYANGVGVNSDMAEAMKSFRTGADKGDANCQTSLGLFYQAGERIPGGVKADNIEAVKWYRLAAEQNEQEAIFHLAQIYLWGDGIKPDTAEAVKWFRKGAEAGNPDAQWMLGNCYKKGVGIEKDMVQAFALISAAVEKCENPEQKKGMGEICDSLKTTLNPVQFKQAQKLTQDWISKGTK